MGSISRTSEIVESEGQLDLMHHAKSLNPIKVKPRVDERARKHLLPTAEHSSIEDELNQLIEAIDIKTRGLATSDKSDKASLGKNPQKRPIRVGISQASEIRISEAVTLKQALRGLCISQASEIAAMKRLTKPRFISGAPESGTIKRLYRAVVVEANDSVVPFSGEAKGSVVEVSIVPEKSTPSSSEEITETLQIPKVNQNVTSSVLSLPTTAGPKKSTLFSPRLKTKLSQVPEVAVSKQKDVSSPNFAAAITSIKTKKSSQDPASSEVGSKTPTAEPRMKGKLNSTSVSNASSGVRKLGPGSGVIRPVVFRNKSFAKKKSKEESNSSTGSSHLCPEAGTLASQAESHKKNPSINSISPATSSTSPNVEVSPNNMVSVTSKPDVDAKCSKLGGTVALKMADNITSREKGESYQSSNSSIGEYSSSTSISDESNLSGSSCNVSRPHMSKDSRWEAIRHVEMKHGHLGLKHFKLLMRLGCGDIGTVYLAELTGSTVMFALKVMDNDFLASRKKMPRAQTEREILQMLDHPFLPTLYTHFTTDKLSCLVMEYCPGGDLHVLRQKQPGRNFHEQAARFYAAEVLLALEYLHMLGVVYRDLKPENILVREDGHIMLSDFDLSLRCAVSPSLVKSSSPPSAGTGKRESGPCVESPCIDPLCLQPSWVQMSCFTPRLISTPSKKRKPKSEMAGSAEASPLPQLVAEPTEARSNSFVGTHEYLAPEIIKGEGHGSAVDWWTFGIFVYELLFGTTPFKGASGNEETLANVVSQNLKFPEGSQAVSFSARDLIRGLLVKEPENRLGSVRGATEIKQHPFFEGLNWALIRCAIPPETPKGCQPPPESRKKESKCLEFKSIGEHLEFELF